MERYLSQMRFISIVIVRLYLVPMYPGACLNSLKDMTRLIFFLSYGFIGLDEGMEAIYCAKLTSCTLG